MYVDMCVGIRMRAARLYARMYMCPPAMYMRVRVHACVCMCLCVSVYPNDECMHYVHACRLGRQHNERMRCIYASGAFTLPKLACAMRCSVHEALACSDITSACMRDETRRMPICGMHGHTCYAENRRGK